MKSVAQLTSKELRQAIEFKRAYGSLADELEILAKGLRDTIAEQRSEIGQRALFAYEIAKRLARLDDRVTLVPHLKTMKRDLGKTRSKVVVPEPVPTTPPTRRQRPQPSPSRRRDQQPRSRDNPAVPPAGRSRRGF